MTLPDPSKFEAADTELAAFTKALSHPARLMILKVLAEKGTCICGQIVEVLPLAQATVSQHLKDLKEAGLIKGEIEGVKSCYCLDIDKINELSDRLTAYLKSLTENQPPCC